MIVKFTRLFGSYESGRVAEIDKATFQAAFNFCVRLDGPEEKIRADPGDDQGDDQEKKVPKKIKKGENHGF